MALTPPPAAPQRGDRATFAQRVDAFITWLINLVAELNIFSANLNSIAAGGAYAIPYRFSLAPSNYGTSAGGWTFWNGGAGQFSLDATNSAGVNILDSLTSFLSSSSAVKAQLRVIKIGDPNSFALIDVTGFSVSSNNLIIILNYVLRGNGGALFDGDAVLLQLTRTGDKGDKGDNGTSLTPMIHVREESAAGAGPATSVSQNTWVKRAFNTVRTNSVTGASLASGQITLPAGTYDYEGNAAGTGCAQHQARLVNVTDNIVASELGTTEYTDSSITTRSVVTGRFVLASTKVFELQHRASSASGSFGSSVNNFGSANVHAEIKLTKVA